MAVSLGGLKLNPLDEVVFAPRFRIVYMYVKPQIVMMWARGGVVLFVGSKNDLLAWFGLWCGAWRSVYPKTQ